MRGSPLWRQAREEMSSPKAGRKGVQSLKLLPGSKQSVKTSDTFPPDVLHRKEGGCDRIVTSNLDVAKQKNLGSAPAPAPPPNFSSPH